MMMMYECNSDDDDEYNRDDDDFCYILKMFKNFKIK
jgi:hypothetical protein